jgi:hypothetical protein
MKMKVRQAIIVKERKKNGKKRKKARKKKEFIRIKRKNSQVEAS